MIQVLLVLKVQSLFEILVRYSGLIKSSSFLYVL